MLRIQPCAGQQFGHESHVFNRLVLVRRARELNAVEPRQRREHRGPIADALEHHAISRDDERPRFAPPVGHHACHGRTFPDLHLERVGEIFCQSRRIDLPAGHEPQAQRLQIDFHQRGLLRQRQRAGEPRVVQDPVGTKFELLDRHRSRGLGHFPRSFLQSTRDFPQAPRDPAHHQGRTHGAQDRGHQPPLALARHGARFHRLGNISPAAGRGGDV